MRKTVTRKNYIFIELRGRGVFNPTLYKKPIENFEESTKGAKKVYLSQLESTHESILLRQEIMLKLDILSKDLLLKSYYLKF